MSKRDFSAEISCLPDVSAFLEEELEKADCSVKTVMQLSVSVEEIFVNIAHYAYPDSKGTVTIEISPDDGYVKIEFFDSGLPFDPLKKPDPDITLSAEERNIGGLGIYMVKKSVDEVKYRYENGQNILTLIKKI